jgi:hypothetical protein
MTRSNDPGLRHAQDRLPEQTARIRALNDALRTAQSGQFFTTRGVAARGHEFVVRALDMVRRFSAFTSDNDPYGEHDFGSFCIDGTTLFWKIDCYDRTMRNCSPDASDPARTKRALTILLAEEY